MNSYSPRTSSKSSPTKKVCVPWVSVSRHFRPANNHKPQLLCPTQGLSPRKSPSAASAKSSPKTAALWAAGGNDNDSDGSIAEDIPDAGDDSDDDF